MGGEGSGRKPDFDNLARKQEEKIAAIGAEELVIPNLSGDHSAGSVLTTPSNETDPVNKEYVDSIATKSAIELFLTENGSVSVGGYFDLEIDVVTAAKENIVQSITAGSATLIASFVTKLGEEEINAIKLLESGIYKHHAHADAATSKNLFIYYEFYHRTAGGTETLLGTSHDSNELTTSEAGYELHASITDEKAFVSGDRIVIKVYGRNKSAAARNVTIYMEGDTASRVEFPAFISSTFVPAHTIAFHSDTSGTGTELNTLTDNSMADALHRHSELSASDGTPDQALIVDAAGQIDILYSVEIGNHLIVGNNITVGGTVDGVDIAVLSDSYDITSGSHTLLSDSYDVLSGSTALLSDSHDALSGAYTSHAADASDPHGSLLTQTSINTTSGGMTADSDASGSAIFRNILIGTEATPFVASGSTQGTVYLQYTA